MTQSVITLAGPNGERVGIVCVVVASFTVVEAALADVDVAALIAVIVVSTVLTLVEVGLTLVLTAPTTEEHDNLRFCIVNVTEFPTGLKPINKMALNLFFTAIPIPDKSTETVRLVIGLDAPAK